MLGGWVVFKRIISSAFLLVSMTLAAPATAVPIIGEVFTDGRFSTDTGNLATATHLDFRIAWTTGGTGSYAPIDGASVAVGYTDFTFSPALSAPVDPLWWFTDGLRTYSFVMGTVSIQTQSASSLQLIGSGMLYITGFDPTPGFWEFSAWSTLSGRFKFTSQTASVPEPGTLALLGLGLLGVGLARRRRA